MSPGEQNNIKEKIKQSRLLTDSEKQEWLALLPEMNDRQLQELEKLLSIKLPETKKEPPKPVTPAAPISQPRPVVRPPIPKVAVESPKLQAPKSSGPADLESLTVNKMREASSIQSFLDNTATRIQFLLNGRQATRTQIASALERSPLYRGYIQSGLKMMDQREDAVLTREEFEAISDFRKRMRKLLA